MPALALDAFTRRGPSHTIVWPLTSTIYTGETKWCAALTVYVALTWNKFLSGPHHPRSVLIPCLKAFVILTAGQQHHRWYSIARWHHLIYWEELQLWLCTTRGLGTNFYQLHTTQEVHWYIAWSRFYYKQPVVVAKTRNCVCVCVCVLLVWNLQ